VQHSKVAILRGSYLERAKAAHPNVHIKRLRSGVTVQVYGHECMVHSGLQVAKKVVFLPVRVRLP
jgi:hypothetical protein